MLRVRQPESRCAMKIWIKFPVTEVTIDKCPGKEQLGKFYNLLNFAKLRKMLVKSLKKSYEGALLYIVLGEDPTTLLKCELFYKNFSRILSRYLWRLFFSEWLWTPRKKRFGDSSFHKTLKKCSPRLFIPFIYHVLENLKNIKIWMRTCRKPPEKAGERFVNCFSQR